MHSGLKTIKQLMDQSRTFERPSMQSFPPVDRDRLSKDLKLTQKAAENAAADQPATDTSDLDAVETSIVSEIREIARKAKEIYDYKMELYKQRIEQASAIGGHLHEFRIHANNAVSDFKVEADIDRDRLRRHLEEARSRDSEILAFQELYKIQRMPYVSSRSANSIRILILILLWALESTINGIFFSSGSETGLIGGFTQALTLSALNIGSAMLFGLILIREVHHVHPLRRTIGMVSIAAYGAIVVMLNFAIGHFRDLFIIHRGDVPMIEMVKTMTNSFWMFSDTQSLILVLIGMGMSIAAFIDAWGMGDPLPGYGSLGFRYRESMEQFNDSKSMILSDLQRLRDEATEDMTNTIRNLSLMQHDLALANTGRQTFHQRYEEYIRHLSDIYMQLMKTYRDMNMEKRKSDPPDRFIQPIEIPSFLIPGELEPATAARGDLLEQAQEVFRDEIRNLKQEYDSAATQYESMSEREREDMAG